MEVRREALVTIVAELAPCTVRQVFYAATVRGVVDKTEQDYAKVQSLLVKLRLDGVVPWSSIADHTRWFRKPPTHRSPQAALRETAELYRKSLWTDADCQTQIWIEKEALAGVIFDVTAEFDVRLYTARGYSSVTYLHEAAADIADDGRPAFVYHLGDYDPSGVDAASKIEEMLRRFAPDTEIHFKRLAVLPSQIRRWRLPTRPTKPSDTRARKFGAESVELDAIDPHRLRALARDAIERHLPAEQLAVLKAAEESERAGLAAWVATLAGGQP